MTKRGYYDNHILHSQQFSINNAPGSVLQTLSAAGLQVKLGLSIDEDELAAEDDELPPLEEDAVDEGSRMEEVD